jgi:hypothetical protein
MTFDTNVTNHPAHILAACRRQLEWIDDPKLRKQVEQRIEQIKKEHKHD